MYKKVFTALIIIYPILAVYSSTIFSLSVADIIMLVLIPLGILRLYQKKGININGEWFFYFIFLFVHALFLYLFRTSKELDEAFMRLMRFAFYIFILFVFIPNFFDRAYGLRILRWASLFAAGFGIMQEIVLQLYGVYIPGVLTFLPVFREELYTYGRNYVSGTLRVRSVFTEPAHLGEYLALYLLLCLLGKSKYKYLDAIIVSAAMIFSVSNTAYIILVLIWLMWFGNWVYGRRSKITRKILIRVSIFLMLFLAATTWFMRSEFFTLFWERFVTSDFSRRNRFDGYDVFSKEQTKNFGTLLFGSGFIAQADFHASIAAMFLRTGVVGIVVWGLVLFHLFKRKKNYTDRMTILTCIILGVGGVTMHSNAIMPYMAFVITDSIQGNVFQNSTRKGYGQGHTYKQKRLRWGK